MRWKIVEPYTGLIGCKSPLPPEVIDIFVNGEPKQVPKSASVAGLLAFLQLKPDRVAVELNKTVIRKRDWETTAVDQGSALEVVEFVGGG